jgi:hypothetical protein
MAISVVVNTSDNITSSVRSSKSVVSSVTIGPQADISLGNLTNVDASNPDDGETLVFDAATNTFIVKELIVDSNNITNINGGTF